MKQGVATPRPWESNPARRITDHGDGEIEVHVDESIARVLIQRVWRDEQDRRCTRFIGEVYINAAGGIEQAQADAELIVTAVNAFDDLVAALKDARGWVNYLRNGVDWGAVASSIAKIDDTLRKASGTHARRQRQE